MMKDEKAYQRIKRIPIKYIPIMIFAALSINILSLALPLTMKQIYSRIIINKSAETLTLLVVGCFVALALEALLRYMKETSGKWISSKYEHQLSTFLVGKLLNSFQKEAEASNYNANLEKFNTISRVTSFYSTTFYQLFIDLPFMLLFLYLIYYLGGGLVIIPVVLSIFYMLFMLYNAARYYGSREEQITSGDQVMTHLTETLEKIHLVKAAGLEEFQISRYKKALKDSTESSYKTGKYAMTPELVGPIFSQLTMFAILIGGGFLMLQGRLSFGEITACALLGSRAIAPVQSIMDLYLQRKDVKLLRSRIEQIAQVKEQYKPGTPAFPEDITGMIEILDLQYQSVSTFKQEKISLQIPSRSFLYIDPVEFLSYRKVLNKIIGKEPIEGGRILIDNLDIAEWDMSNLKGKIEYVSEHISIFKGSVLDNITNFNPIRSHDAYEAAALTGLDEMVEQLTDGFETQLDTQAVNYLSSAFLQRLNLTRALLIRPRILILDRIDESMDKETLKVFLWLLEKFKGRITLIVVTGNPIIREMADGAMEVIERTA